MFEFSSEQFNLRCPDDEFTCKEVPRADFCEGADVVTYLNKFILSYEDGTSKEMTPVVYESCMNPGEKILTPIQLKTDKNGEELFISNGYVTIMQSKITKESDSNKKTDAIKIVSVYVEEYIPTIRKGSCTNCINCGRC